MDRLMSMAVGRTLAVAGLLAASAVASASAPSEHLTIRPGAGLALQTLSPPKLVLTVGDQMSEPRSRSHPTTMRLMIDPQYYRWEIDALGGAWLSPVVTGSAFVGRLVFRF
jgi:hypothetical protein